jgi:Tfp pilus assembly protein PilN
MINLLPPNVKQDITYARRNSVLVKWCMTMVLGIAAIIAVVFIGLVYMDQSIKSYTADADLARDQLKSQKLEDTQAKVESISSSFKLVIQVLSKQILFSKLIKQIGSAIPNNASLTELRINQVKGGLDISAVAKDYKTATQVQVNLQDPENEIFEKADIINITCGSASDDTRYPCTVNIRALFSTKNNQFLFLAPSAGATP